MSEYLRQPSYSSPWGGDVYVDPDMPANPVRNHPIRFAGQKAAEVLGSSDLVKGISPWGNRGSVRREEDRVSVMLNRPPGQVFRPVYELVHVRFVFDSEALDEVIGVMGVKSHWEGDGGEITRSWLYPFSASEADRELRPDDIYRSVSKAVTIAKKHTVQRKELT